MKTQIILSIAFSVLAANAFADVTHPTQQTSHTASHMVAQDGSDRTLNRVAQDGSDRTLNRVAQDGSDHVLDNRV